MYITLPNGQMFTFGETSRQSVMDAINTQDLTRGFRDFISVADTQDKYKVLLPTYVFAEYLSLCLGLSEDDTDEFTGNRPQL